MNQQANTGEKHILFVDDEPGVLRALRRALRRRTDWKLSFAESAEHALEQMAEAPFDIVVSDVTMPTTDGVALLRQVRRDYPDTLRVLMSGAAHDDLLRQAVHVAHRFFSKPWDLAVLIGELEHALKMRDLMSPVAIRTVIGGMSSQPVLPGVLRELRTTLENPTSRLRDIASVVEQDPAMVARVMHIVNSDFFSGARALISTSEALRYLGTSRLKALVLNGEIFRALDDTRLPPSFSPGQFQQHALLTARIAAAMAETKACRLDPCDPGKARNAGLLHSIGMLILADTMPERWGPVHQQARSEGRALHELERDVLQTTYADVGAYLLGCWGLPQDLVQSVAQHCSPMRKRSGAFNLVAITHLASVLAAQELGLGGHQFDGELLDALDGEDSMAAWRAIAAGLRQK